MLAGGAGRRLGRDKASLVVDGHALAARAAAALAPLCPRVLISIRTGGVNPAAGFEAIEDEPPAGRGPLAGLVAGFAAAPGSDLLVLACDYPRVTESLLRKILAAATAADDVVFPVDEGGRDHPLVGLWRGRIAGAARAAVGEGRLAVRDLLAGLAVRRLSCRAGRDGAADGALVNVNRPEDLRRFAG